MCPTEPPTPDSQQLWLVPAEGRTVTQRVVAVAVERATHTLATYGVPIALSEQVRPGAVVTVPYGRSGKPLQGICLHLSDEDWTQTRAPVLEVREQLACLTPPLIELGLWLAQYYVCTPWKTFAAIVPLLLRDRPEPRRRNVRRTATEVAGKLPEKQARLLSLLGDRTWGRSALLAEAGVTAAVLRALEQKGLVEAVVEQPPWEAAGDAVPHTTEDDYALTGAQQAALDHLVGRLDADRRFETALLFGVPGSGKTEVYVRAMRAAVARGRQAVMLVPEIALTTQLVERLRRRFARVVVLHGQLTVTERRAALDAIAAGQVDVVIGTRTAVFAPCPRLGLMIVDEEQETSFKNLASPYYHARDVAVKRGHLEGFPVVLGSGTPALESWHNAHERGNYTLLPLPERVPGAQVPRVELVETDRVEDGGGKLLAPRLRAALRSTCAAGAQAILLHNRRGYAVYLRCRQCGLLVQCERCGTALVYHRIGNTLKCHRCGAQQEVPRHCLDDTCRGPLGRAGAGIQQLEEELRECVPEARLLRLDRDTMNRREEYEAALQRFERHEADVLLGTQMVAKGLDFPEVRLVGVIEADAALGLPDFRAGERVFQLVVQVVGRAGRKTGESLALVQTQQTSFVIRTALEMDYEKFAQRELEVRQRLQQPPWTRLVRIVCADARAERARAAAADLAEQLRARAERISALLRVDGPEACVIPRLRELRRHEVLIRGPRDASLSRLLAEGLSERWLRPHVARVTIDVDPVDLL